MAAYIWWGTPELPARALCCSTNVGSLEESLLADGGGDTGESEAGSFWVPAWVHPDPRDQAKSWRRSQVLAGALRQNSRRWKPQFPLAPSEILGPRRLAYSPHVPDLTHWVANRATAVRYGVSITSFCGSQVPNLPVSRIGNIAAHQ